MAELNQTTISVEHESNTFTFRIPTLRDEARLSTVVQGLIAEDNGGELKESSLDAAGQFAYRTLAVFKTMLLSSSAPWAYIEDPKTKAPVPNPNLPPEAMAVYMKYLDELNKFFRGGATDSNTPS